MGNYIELPCVVPIPDHVTEGGELKVQALTKLNCNGIYIVSLCSQPTVDQGEIIFQIKFKHRGAITMNYRKGGEWGKDMVFVPGYTINFTYQINMLIKALKDQFQVTVNTNKKANFAYQLPLGSIKYLVVEGNYPKCHVEYDPGTLGLPPMIQNVLMPTVPLETPIQGGFIVGRKIIIKGRPEEDDPKRFQINLACANDDLVLNIDARFKYERDTNRLHRNYRKGGSFGSSETQGYGFPFKAGQPFEMEIECERDRIMIRIDDSEKTKISFYHKVLPPYRATRLQVEGDVRLGVIEFE